MRDEGARGRLEYSRDDMKGQKISAAKPEEGR